MTTTQLTPNHQPGDLIAVNLYNPKSKKFDSQSGARLKRISCGNYFVKLAGLEVPSPYQIGDNLVIDESQVIITS